MKYSVCQLADDNNNFWFQIKVQWWFFSYYHGDSNYGNYDDFVWNREPNRYVTRELAQEDIEKLIVEEKSRKIRLVVCE